MNEFMLTTEQQADLETEQQAINEAFDSNEEESLTNDFTDEELIAEFEESFPEVA